MPHLVKADPLEAAPRQDAGGPAASLAQRVCVLTSAAPKTSLGRMLSWLEAVEITRVELLLGEGSVLSGGGARDLARARRALEAGGASACGVAAPATWPIGCSSLIRAVETAAELNAPFVRVFAPRYDPHRRAVDQLKHLMRALDALRGYTAGTNAELLIETAQGTVVPSPELARRVIEESGSDRLGVVYDPANMASEGHLQPAFAVSYLGPLLRHVHAKNRVLVRRSGSWASKPMRMDHGHVDWSEVAGALTANGYEGLLSIDHLSGRPSRARLQEDVEALRRLVGGGAR
jgi:sugar phosphate isomerase/epimerase